MKTVEFKARMKNKSIKIPNYLSADLSEGKDIRVIILVDEADNRQNSDFKELSKDQFLAGYSDADSVYDDY